MLIEAITIFEVEFFAKFQDFDKSFVAPCDVAALIRLDVIGLQPLWKTKEQTTDQYPQP